MRNKAAGASKRGPRSGLGKSAAGKDGAEAGERVRLDRLRTKVRMCHIHALAVVWHSLPFGRPWWLLKLHARGDQVRDMLLGHRVRLIDAFRVFDANNSKRLGLASTLRSSPSSPPTPPHNGFLPFADGAACIVQVLKRCSCPLTLRRRRSPWMTFGWRSARSNAIQLQARKAAKTPRNSRVL